MSAFLVAWGDFIIAGAAFVGGAFVEKKFGVYDKVMSAFAWIKGLFGK